MSKVEASGVVVPGSEGSPKGSEAAEVKAMSGGGLVLSPMPLSGGRRHKRLSKKTLKMLKKMGMKKVAKMIKKGGQTEGVEGEQEGARRRTRRRSSKKY